MSIEQVSVEYFFDHDVIAVVQQIFVFNQSKYSSDHEIWWIFSGATKTRGVRSFNSPTFSSPLFIISWRWLGHHSWLPYSTYLYLDFHLFHEKIYNIWYYKRTQQGNLLRSSSIIQYTLPSVIFCTLFGKIYLVFFQFLADTRQIFQI